MDQGDIRAFVIEGAKDAGAVAVGFARAGRVEESQLLAYHKWIGEGRHGELDYLRRHQSLKESTDSVLPGARTVISLAFSYQPERLRDPELPQIARFAYGDDYHDVLRVRLRPLVEDLRKFYGAQSRICIDSAPVAERYWALRAGIGRRGINGSVILDGYGSYIFLAEILTSLEIEPYPPSTQQCLGCGKCIKACPTGALGPDGVDASRCLSALTIEHKGPWSAEQRRLIESIGPDAPLFGCDRCQEVCPHNSGIFPSLIEEFLPSEELLSISAEDMAAITPEKLREPPFRRSPLRRAKADGLRRNAKPRR